MTFPSRPVRLVVPFGQEGASDRVARIVASGLMRRWRKPVLVENAPGGSGVPGALLVTRAPPDGHTLLFGTVTNRSIAPRMVSTVPYDFERDLAPLGLVGFAPNVLVVPASLPVASVAELIAYANGHPGAVNYASAGAGQTIHLCGELFRVAAGVDIQHRPYSQGSATAYDDLVNGRVQLMFDSIAGALPDIRSGALRALAVVADARAPLLPDVPTMREAGVEGVVAPIWFGVFAPAAIEGSVREQIEGDLAHALADAPVIEALAALGVDRAATTSDAMRASMAEADAVWARNLARILKPGLK